MSYPVADTLIRLKNAQKAKQERVWLPFSRVSLGLGEILKAQGFIESLETRKKKVGRSEKQFIEIKLHVAVSSLADSADQPRLIDGVKIVSKPSRRFYVKSREIKPILSGQGLAIISTSRGLKSGEAAKKEKLGGEWLATVW